MKDLTLRAYVDETATIKYRRKDFKEQIQSFKKSNLLEDIEISFAQISSVEHYQFKYLYGYVYASIGFYSSELDFFVVDYDHKKEFLFEKCDGIKDIPKKYRAKCQIVLEKRIKVDENGEVEKDEAGNVIYYDVVSGYIKAKRDLNFDEMAMYITQLEQRLFLDMQGQLGKFVKGNFIVDGEIQREAGNIRDMAFNKDPDQLKIFAGQGVDGIDFDEQHEIKEGE